MTLAWSGIIPAVDLSWVEWIQVSRAETTTPVLAQKCKKQRGSDLLSCTPSKVDRAGRAAAASCDAGRVLLRSAARAFAARCAYR
eukprot:scaffold111294_cov69-Phaeocystis_antarctica.AAC.1